MTVTKTGGGDDSVKAYYRRTNAPLAAQSLLAFPGATEAQRSHLKGQFTKLIDAGTLDSAFGTMLAGIEAQRPLLQGRFDALSQGMQALSKATYSVDEAMSETYQMGRPGELNPDVRNHNIGLMQNAVRPLREQLAALDAGASMLSPDEKTFLDGAKYIIDFKIRQAEQSLRTKIE